LLQFSNWNTAALRLPNEHNPMSKSGFFRIKTDRRANQPKWMIPSSDFRNNFYIEKPVLHKGQFIGYFCTEWKKAANIPGIHFLSFVRSSISFISEYAVSNYVKVLFFHLTTYYHEERTKQHFCLFPYTTGEKFHNEYISVDEKKSVVLTLPKKRGWDQLLSVFVLYFLSMEVYRDFKN